jgi:S1-C subfamily serine protease
MVTLAAALLSAPASACAGDESEYQTWLEQKSPALVTVKFVLKIKMGGMMGGMGDQETDSEITGIMIDPKGLVLCSNTQFGGLFGMIGRFMGPMAGNISANPTDIKVLVGDDTEGLEAKLLARDTELDLAWVQIEEPGDAKFAFCDMARNATPQIGQRFFGVRRMGKFFDRVAAVVEGRVGGITAKPRDLYVPTTSIAAMSGLPIFATDGAVLGVTVAQMPDAEDEPADPMGMLGSMLGGMQGAMEGMGGLILPAAEVVKATKRALETAEAEEAAGAEDSAEAEEAD